MPRPVITQANGRDITYDPAYLAILRCFGLTTEQWSVQNNSRFIFKHKEHQAQKTASRGASKKMDDTEFVIMEGEVCRDMTREAYGVASKVLKRHQDKKHGGPLYDKEADLFRQHRLS